MRDGSDKGESRWENVMALRAVVAEAPTVSLVDFLTDVALVADVDELADEVDRVIARDMIPVRGPIQAAKEWLDLPLRYRSRAELEKEANGPASTAHNPRRILELLDRSETPATRYRVPVGMWRFGDDLTLVTLPGETVSGYIPRIEQIIDSRRLWVAGYCEEVFGYLPTAKIIGEGGYEDRGLVCEIGQFDTSVEDVVVDGVRRLARRLDVV